MLPKSALLGWLGALSLLAASAVVPAAAQEPAPEPVVEDALPEVEPVVESEQAAPESSNPAPESSSRATPVVDPPSRVARLGYIDGEVTVAPAGTEEWADAALNRPLTSGDRVWVEDDGRAELQMGSAAVYLDGDTGFGLIELDDDVLQASLTEGVATVRIRRLAEGETVQVETSHSTVYLNRVGEYHIEVDKDGDRTIVKTRHGEAEVKSDKERFVVRDNERGVFSGVENLTGRIEPIGPRTAFEEWANERDGRNERSNSARYVSRDVIGYEDLDDHGEWVSEPEYGYVWRPTYVVSGWAPYRYGRWVYVSPWGWSWVDDARWGFAPFHYGRWAYIRHRWCWVPGPRHIRPVYAPALVGWVGGPSVSVSVSFGNVGWYPLAPYDYYYPGYRCTPRYSRFVNVSNTIIVSNNYFYGGRNFPRSHFDHGRHGYGVTAVSRDHFVGGRPISNHLVRIGDSDMRRWRGVREPPAITPYRESVLAGQVRQPPRDADRFRDMRRGGDYFAGRVPFHTERRAIESNGGRPVGRSELRSGGNPKDRGDFFSVRPGTNHSDIKRADRGERTGGSTAFSSGGSSAPRELNNGSVRDWPNRIERDRERDRSGSAESPRARPLPRVRTEPPYRANDNREPVEIIRGTESRGSSSGGSLRRDHMERPPSNAFQQRDRDREANYYRPRTETREPARSTRSESRPWGQSQPRSEPRRDYSPPARVQPRSEPRSEPRSSPQPRQNFERSQPRSNNNSGSSGDRSRHSGSRPMSQPRER